MKRQTVTRRHAKFQPRPGLLACALASCLAVAAPAVLAQSTSAIIHGRVTLDAAPAGGATVTVTNTGTGLSRSAETSESGSYSLAGLPPGTYRVDVAAGGSTVSRVVTVRVGQTARLDLSAGGVAETGPVDDATELDTITVTGTVLAETRTSEIATYVSQKQIEALPQNSRNFLAFADTVPGMQFITSPNGQESQLRSGAQGSSAINVYIDGVGQKNYVTPGGITGQDDSEGNPFPQAAIGEYKVITSNYKAEYDQISSAAVTAVTRSGTNEFHGSAFWDRSSEGWTSPSPREDAAGEKDEESVDQYGLSFGGPIIRDKLHFFLVYEGKDIVRPAPVLPPNQLGAADVAALPSEIRSRYGTASRPFNQDTYFGKLSWQVTDEHLIEFIARERRETGVLGIGGVNVPSAGTALNNDESRYDLRSVYSTVNWLNDAHVTFEEAAYNPSPISPISSNRYTVVDPTNANNLELQVLNTGGGPNFQDKGQKGWGFQDDLTWFGWEGHTVKMGIKYKQVDLKAFQQFPPFPRYWYDVNESLTRPYRVEYTTARPGRDPFVESKNKQFGIYIQDDWEVTDKLTLNLGIRWDYEEIPSYTDYRLDPDIAAALRGWTNIQNTDYDVEDYISNGSNRSNFKGAWQPRLGFSYDLSGDQRHVIFGGAGRAYDRNLFDYMAREYYGGAFTTYRINFPSPIHCDPGTGATCTPFDPALLTPEGLAAYAAANPMVGGEVQLLNNDLKTPYSDQYSIGMRNIVEWWGHDWNTSVTLSHIRSRDGIYFHLGNRRPDGSFHEFENLGQTWGNAPFGFAIPGYGSLILGDNGFEYNLNSLLVSLDKPFTEASPWGFNLAYTYSDGEENRPNASNGETFLFDYPFATSQYYPSTGVPEHRLVLSGIYSPGWDLTFSGKLVLESHKPRSSNNCLDSPPEPEPNYLCYYDPYTPDGSIGYKRFDLAAEKRWNTGSDVSFRVRADLINVFDWANWNQFDGRYGLGNGGRLPVNPDLGERNGNEIIEPSRTFKLSFGIDW
ncbi:TonB-dependent receptor [Marilutibacter chinensis]|uniref:TonB-dependent receptor n=1 Tax=Marilutibacter chinensis TaxID=2912247 RepID=A0ABS9HNL1_9GAMM|nr:TonB-dependent receptor [Lysobacter chinensis]MCF7220208.1 TonB-dependent receptor [Lysobacter chinensis]